MTLSVMSPTMFRCTEPETKEEDMKQDVVSVSQLTTFTHCRYRWYLHYISYGGIRLKDEHLPLPMRLGSIWDEFQNAWYMGRSFKEEFPILIDRYDIPDDAPS